jgi:predicted PurR-regulated permease PerM
MAISSWLTRITFSIFFALSTTVLAGYYFGFPTNAQALIERLEQIQHVEGPDGVISESEWRARVQEHGLDESIKTPSRSILTDVRSILQWYSFSFGFLFLLSLGVFRPSARAAYIVAIVAASLHVVAGAGVAWPFALAFVTYVVMRWVALWCSRRGLPKPE